MNIESIEQRIKELGYFTILNDGVLVIGKKIQSDPEITGGILYDIYCKLSVLRNKIVVEDSQNQIPVTTEFQSITSALSFINNVYPI